MCCRFTSSRASWLLVHKDPFDRMLVAQCLAEPLVLLTNDGVLADYGDVVKVVSTTSEGDHFDH